MMKKTVALLMAVVMMLTLTACGTKPANTPTGDDPLVGTWNGEIDYAGIINAMLASDETLAVSGVQSTATPIAVTYVFDENGKVTCSIDRETLGAALKEICKEIIAPLIAMMGQDVDTYLKEGGAAAEEMLMSVFPNGFIEQMENVFTFSGAYTFAGDTLTVKADKHELKSTVELDGGTLTLKEPVGVNMESDVYQQAVKALYPLVLTKS